MKALIVFLCLVAAPLLHAQSADAEALRMEMVFWESVRNSNDPADFRAYLEQYPKGRFAPLANNRLRALDAKPAAQPPAASPAQSPAPQAGVARSSPRSGPPIPGDTWTYALRDPRTGQSKGQQEVRLVSVDGQAFIEEVVSSGSGRARIEHRPGNYLSPSGEITLFSPYALNFGTPAFGRVDNLDGRTCRAGWTCSVRGSLAGNETVRVPAGSFNAVRVEITQSWTTPSQTNDRGESVSRTITVWYAQDVKRIVRATGRGSPSAWIDTQFELELVSYQLK